MSGGYPKVYAVVNRNKDVREKSSSGGAFFSIAKYVIDHDGVVFGAGYDEKFNVIHKMAQSIKDISLMMTSKYVQSSIGHTFEDAYNMLNEKRLVLFCGTPCQILGLTSYLRIKDRTQEIEKKLICLEIFCFGVPSRGVWRKYLNSISVDRDVVDVGFRAKDEKRGLKTLRIVFSNGEKYVSKFTDDFYYKAFSSGVSLRKSCYACKAKKSKRQPDIMLGDFWGIETISSTFDHEKGVSAVIINSDKGYNIFNIIANDFVFEEFSLTDVMHENIYFKNSVPISKDRSKFFENYKKQR